MNKKTNSGDEYRKLAIKSIKERARDKKSLVRSRSDDAIRASLIKKNKIGISISDNTAKLIASALKSLLNSR